MFDYILKCNLFFSPDPTPYIIYDEIYKSIKEKPSTSITVWLRRLITIPENPSKFFIKL